MLLRWDNEVPGQTVRIPTPLPTWDGVGYISEANPDPHTGETEVLELPTIKTGNVAVANLSDLDGDLVLDINDNCILAANPGQEDGDGDAVGDACDNCTLVPNGPSGQGPSANSQRDTDGDGFGNACDADFNNNGIVDPSDFSVLKSSFGAGPDPVTGQPSAPNQDLNGNGIVDPGDFSILKQRLGTPPGPSALAP